MGTKTRPAFYALEAGTWRDYITILHPPYTLWHLSYVVIGAALGPTLHLERLAWTVLAFFLAVGIGAHALDELKGRPLGTRIPQKVLVLAAGASLAGAVTLGFYWSFTTTLGMLPFVAFGVFIVVAYNLELFHGLFHNDFWFAAAWGSFPFVTGYWVNAQGFSAGAGLVAAACFLLSLAQRALSKQVRYVRRGEAAVGGHLSSIDGHREVEAQLGPVLALERALQWLSLAVVALAVGLLVLKV